MLADICRTETGFPFFVTISGTANVVFVGAGTRWPAELTKLSHPANRLYNTVRPVSTGASCGCGAVFGASKEVQACGLPETKDNPLQGTPGLASIRRYLAEGWQTLIF